jgi:hypothetical protein
VFAGEEKWGALKEEIEKIQNKISGGRGGVANSVRRTANTVEDIVFAHLYPRLDIAVSRHLNHLLKAPFAIHPKTGRVCTPMDISKVDDFDPTTVPTIGLLFEEMEKLGPDVKRKTEWQHTSMKGPVEIFKKFVEGLSVENQARRKELGGAEPTLWRPSPTHAFLGDVRHRVKLTGGLCAAVLQVWRRQSTFCPTRWRCESTSHQTQWAAVRCTTETQHQLLIKTLC